MTGFFGDDRDELHGGGAGADDADALPGKVDFFMWPSRHVDGPPAEGVTIFLP